MAFTRIQHSGGAATTTLNADIGSGDTSLTLVSSTGWPDGSVAPFYLVIDTGTSAEEKILATARSGATLTGLTRGVDGTSAASHSAGAAIVHCFTALEADEANQAAKATLGTVTTKGDLLVASASQALARLGVGTDTYPLVANSGATNGINWAQLTGAGIANNTIDSTKITTTIRDGSTITGGNGTPLGVPTDGITATQIAAGAVGTSELAAGAVTVAKLATQIGCRVTNSANQSIPDTTVTTILFDTETYDTDTMHSTVTNTGRITFTTAGYYLLIGRVAFDVNNVGHRTLYIRINGSNNVASANATVFNTVASIVEITHVYRATAADYAELRVDQTSGGALDSLASASLYPSWLASFMGPL
jgi:hypothetical protein